MKKISIFLVAMLLISLFAVQAGATEETRVHAGRHCVCGGSAVGVEDHVCNNLPWKRLPEGTTDLSQLANGNYYLTEDVTITKTVTGGDDSPWKDKKINLCLNGYDISTEVGSVFGYVDLATINICDCSGTRDASGNWHWDGTITANRAGKSISYGGVFNLRADALANIYGGNFVGAVGAHAGGIFNVCHDGYDKNGLTYASNTAAELFTKLTVYNGHFSGGEVVRNSKDQHGFGGLINTWHNADVHIYGGTFFGGSAYQGGNLYLSKSGDHVVKNCIIINGTAVKGYGNFYAPSAVIDMTNVSISGGSPEVAYTVKGGKYLKGYTALGDAFAAAKDTSDTYVQLLQDLETDLTVAGTVYLDMNGCDLSGVTVEGTLYAMDSTTNGYYGSNAGVLTPASGLPAQTVKTTADRTGNIYRYLRVADQEGYSFHRFYIGITDAVLSPDRSGLGLKATFAGDAQVKSALATQNAFGMGVSLSPIPDSLENDVIRALGSEYYQIGSPFSKRLVVYDILDPEATNNNARAAMEIYGKAFIRLADGTVLFSEQAHKNLRQIVEYVNGHWDAFTDAQKDAVDAMIQAHEMYTSGWNVANIHHHDTTKWQPWPEDNKWVSGGHYYLTHDLTDKTVITVAEGKSLNICLNGFDIQGAETASRILQIKGTVTIHDHCDENGDYAGDIVTNFTGYTMAPVFYVYENAEFNLCGGNLKAAEGVVSQRGGVGMIGNGSQVPNGVMNMYNGTVSGGYVQAKWDSAAGTFTVEGKSAGVGGNIEMIASSTLNMYDGSISGGRALYAEDADALASTKRHGDGGNLHVSPSATVNVYAGEISGGYVKSGNGYTGMGGNIYTTGGTLNLSDCAVIGGTAENGIGGNIYTGGVVNGKNLTVTGGTAGDGLSGGIYATKEITLSGQTKIRDNTGGDLHLSQTGFVDGSGLTSGSSVGLTSVIHGQISSNGANKGCFFSNQEGYQIAEINGCVALIHEGLDPALVESHPGSFSVGYSMVDITPLEDGLVMSSFGNPNGRKSSGVNYRLQATTVAVSDKDNNTFLMVTLDLQNMPIEYLDNICGRISQVTGVPAANIYLSCTHTHNVPDLSNGSVKNIAYRGQLMNALIQGALDAMADRASSTMQTGSFDTVKMNFSRHYYYPDENGLYTDAEGNKISYFGDQFGTQPKDNSIIKRVEPGDETMHMIAFQRSGKDPVLVVNWRAHPHRSGGKEKYTIDADVIGALREYMHANTDYQFAFFQGAAGNMNTTSRITGETYKTGKITEYGNELGRQIIENGLPKLKDTPTGKVQTTKVMYAAQIDHSEDDRYEQAVELNNYYRDYPDLMDTYEEQITKAAELGFSSVFHAQRLIRKYKLGPTSTIELNIFSIGDSVGFFTGPGEFWDSVSEEMEARSPFATTFCLGYCNGNVAYIPYKITHYSSYEYHYCLFTQDDTIEQMMNIYEENLNKFFSAAK